MHVDRLTFDRVEDEIVLNNEVAISHADQFFLVGDSPKVWMFGEKPEALFNLCRKPLSCRGSVGSNVGDKLSEVLFGNPQESDAILRPTHGCVFEGPSSPEKVCGLYHHWPAVLEQRPVS